MITSENIFYLKLTNTLKDDQGNTIQAKMAILNEMFVLLKGSYIDKVVKPSFIEHHYFKMRKRYETSEFLKDSLHKKYFELKKNIEFSSPSAAAVFVQNRASNGRKDWKLENGITLDEFEYNSNISKPENKVNSDKSKVKDFKNWLIHREGKKHGTSGSYSSAITKLSEHYSSTHNNPINIYEISGFEELDLVIELYDFKGTYFDVGQTGNATYRNALKAYRRYFLSGDKNLKYPSIDTSIIKSKPTIEIKEKPNELLTFFNQELTVESEKMSSYYAAFYCLERSIRDLVKERMNDNLGQDWWEKVDFKVRENVSKNLEYELDTTHTKRSDNKIDYTTFGDLRKIINSNWTVFRDSFVRNLTSVNEVMIDLNRLRVPIAHCTPLAPKEQKRLEIRLDDWNELLKKQ